MSPTAVVLGASGQDGHYLCGLLRQRGFDPIGVARSSGPWHVGDVGDRSFVGDLIRSSQPAYVFHLAANSSTDHETLFENHETIATGALNVLEAVRDNAPRARVFITGSGVQFRSSSSPVHESDPFEATSPYAVARIQSAYAARYYRAMGMRAYVGYLFHHESPQRAERHVSQQVIRGLRRISNGDSDTLEISDPTVRREWLFAEDAMRGALALMNQESVFEATIGSGVAYSVEDWIAECALLLGVDRTDFTLVSKPDFTPEYRLLVSDPTTIRSIGWEPRVGFRELAARMVHD